MTRARIVRATAAALGAAVIALGAASALAAGGVAEAPPGAGPAPPPTLAGLSVHREAVSGTLQQNTQPLYVDQVALYTLRAGKELQATLQIARFKPGTPWTSADFDLSIASQLGASQALVVRLDGEPPIYLSSSRGLGMALWFKQDHLYLLMIRRAYTKPRSLIRACLEIGS